MMEFNVPRGPHRGSWVLSGILGKCDTPGTYAIRVLVPNGPDLQDVPASALRHPPVQVGQNVEVWALAGKRAGSWLRCNVTGEGTDPNTYDLHVSVPGGDILRNVPAHEVRHLAEEAPELTLIVKYEVGDLAEIFIDEGPSAGSWLRCNITGIASAPDRYHIHVLVPDGPHLQNIVGHVLRPLVQTPRAPPTASPGNRSYEVGETAEVNAIEGPYTGSWLRCVITGKGRGPNMYNIRLPMPPSGLDLADVPTTLLRPLPGGKVNGESDVHPLLKDLVTRSSDTDSAAEDFKVGEPLEVGTKGGQWVRCIVTAIGAMPGTYNIRVLALNSDGFMDVPDVPAARLRREARQPVNAFMGALDFLFSWTFR